MNGYTVVTDAPQGSDEWLQARRGGIGGSDVAAVLGMNPWRSPIEVWLDKTGQAAGFTGNERTEWGHKLEPVVRAHYAALRPRAWVDEVPGVLAHPDIPIARASLDGLVNDADGQRILEVKCTAQSWDQPPDMYLWQAIWYMAVTGLPAVDFAVLTRGNTYTEYTVDRPDDAVCTDLLTTVDDWWAAHVLAGAMPDVDVVRDRDLLARLWTPDVAADPVVIPDDLAARLRDSKATANAAKTDYEVACAEVQALMREAVAAVDEAGDRIATWNPTKGRTTINRAALKADGRLDKYTLTGEPGRTFRVSL